MQQKAFKTIAIVALVVAVIGLISFLGGMRSVNIGVFVFPILISGIFFWLYKKNAVK